MKRNTWRAIVFLSAAVLALQVLPWPETTMGFLSLSPLLGLLGALAVRGATLWTVICLPVLAMAFFRPRWFCRMVCPVGFATEQVGRLNPRGRARFAKLPSIGRLLFLLLLGAAAAGYPAFIWLDPLSLFSGFFAAWRVPLAASSLALAVGFPAALLVSLLLPNAWCHRICPLGAGQDFLALARRRLQRQPAKPPSPSPSGAFQLDFTRRGFLGVVAGGAGALALRRFLPRDAGPIRPPGARAEPEFTGLCARCGACIRACPHRILSPDIGQSGLAGFLTPAVAYSDAYCSEFCHDCTKVCPTGAIERLTLEAKRTRAIGLARVEPNRCIAWNRGRPCMACQQACPYLAIDGVVHNGVTCPVVIADRCRGCGACQVACPVPGEKAILVDPIPQRTLSASLL